MTIKPLLQVESHPEESAVSDFLRACVSLDATSRTAIRDLHARHVTWCQQTGHTPLPSRRLGRYIQAPRQHANGVAYILGIRLT